MKKIIVIAVVIAIAVVIVHDLGAFVTARRMVTEGTREAGDVAAGLATQGRDTAAREAVATAAKRGVEIVSFNQDETYVEVEGRIEISGTWVYAPLVARISNRPPDELPVLKHQVRTPIR